MSASLTRQYEPGVVYDIRIGVDGDDTRHVAVVEYDRALAILDAKPPRHEGIPADNGAIELKSKVKTFKLFDGKARMLSDYIEPGSVCVSHAGAAVADPENWRWAKLRVEGGDFDGIACLGIKTETKEAIIVRIDL